MNRVKIIIYLTACALVSIIMATIYVTVQQVYRSNAKDSRIQIAYSLKDNFQNDSNTKNTLLADSFNLNNSLHSFAGLSPKEIEAKESNLSITVLIAWVSTLLTIIFCGVVISMVKEKNKLV